VSIIVIYKPSAKRHFSHMSANVPNTSSHIEVCTYFLKRTFMSNLSCTFCEYLALVHAKVSIELIPIYFHFFEIFNIQIGEIVFCKPDFIIIKSNYFGNAQKGECFLDDFEALVREIYVCGCEISF
jgi:hypothetical protein